VEAAFDGGLFSVLKRFEQAVKQETTINLKYTLKPSTHDAILPESKTVLDLCVQEPEFITAILQETTERPNEAIFFEMWRGFREDFICVQSPKPYRKAYLAKSERYVVAVEAIFECSTQGMGYGFADAVRNID